ncbi:ABC transporter ATP-binding protein [Streptomyces antarcticus]|uniref:ABC transporter ATP-binding protein n=1 Tax=Streptomyces antarcticus TaxID=2996458 RepID=UPI00226EAC1B|nr:MULTISPECIES: ABC transporter ATP-binding protein [unclassified Streptomyces]MCY0945314.1 ABC transporter ATP-binding protein [Streptomyces sp. H34-AA3]MCZ4081590.1 ABC transporter ATP-binding protein [Streptomyces sp. H34-S5]
MKDPTVAAALQAARLGREFRGRWALRGCDVDLPAGRVTALVGPNGAGKSTLLQLAAGLLRPTTGRIRVHGHAPGTREAREATAFLAQEKPLHLRFTVADTLRLGRKLNRRWDQALAESLVRAGNIPLTARVGSLSGGNRTRVALALALGKRAELLLLDEPLADLDPVARHEITGLLMYQAAEHGVGIVMSTHVLAELEDICDHVLLLKDGAVRLSGDTGELRDAHTLLTGRADPIETDGLPHAFDRSTVVHATITGRQVTALVRTPPGSGAATGSPGGAATGAPADPRWIGETPSLEALLLAHLRAPRPDRTEEAA